MLPLTRLHLHRSSQAGDEVSFLTPLLLFLFCKTGHEVSIALLGPLRDLDRVATFDWGSTALTYLSYRLDTVCRGAVMMCGFWHVLHVRSLSFSFFNLLHHFLY